MRHLFIFLITLFSLSVSGQTWCGGCAECEFIQPPPAYDSVFVIMSDSYDGVTHCRGTWTSIEDAGLPRYKVYVATLTQVAEAAPTVDVLYNTLGVDLTWTRSETGVFLATDETGSDPFEETGKTPSIGGLINDDLFMYFGVKTSSNVFTLSTYGEGAVPADGVLDETTIEIRVYF